MPEFLDVSQDGCFHKWWYHHPFQWGFPFVNHPFGDVPHLWKLPHVSIIPKPSHPFCFFFFCSARCCFSERFKSGPSVAQFGAAWNVLARRTLGLESSVRVASPHLGYNHRYFLAGRRWGLKIAFSCLRKVAAEFDGIYGRYHMIYL